jgi:CreA protein
MLFGEYLGRFANYGATYGSLAGVIAALLFFYVSAILFVYGGHLNAALYRRRKEGKREMRTMKSATLLVAFALGSSVPAWSEEIGSVDTAFKLIGPNHKIVVEAFDDPKVQNVACHVSRAKKGGISGAIGTAEETSDASIACRQIGPITIKEELKDGEEVFNERRSILFKRLRVVRFLDKTRNTLVYVVYSDKLIEGSPKNSLSTVPIMPWGH